MSTNQDKQEDRNNDIFHFAGNTMFSGTAVIFFFIILVAIAILVINLGDNAGQSFSDQVSDEEKTNNLFIILFVGILFIIALMGGIRYFFGTNIHASISNLFGSDPEIDVVIDHRTIKSPTTDAPHMPAPKNEDYELPDTRVPEPREEVFNVPGNYYGYQSAKNLCAAYDSRLATYNEIENAYENGAEWCNYGWSEGQMALFPTQESTYLKLQGIEGHENDCGRPGINGGIIENQNVKFGVNCYGIKPTIDADEMYLMENSTRFPKTRKDNIRDKEIERMKKNLDNILVSPYNNEQWSRY